MIVYNSDVCHVNKDCYLIFHIQKKILFSNGYNSYRFHRVSVFQQASGLFGLLYEIVL